MSNPSSAVFNTARASLGGCSLRRERDHGHVDVDHDSNSLTGCPSNADTVTDFCTSDNSPASSCDRAAKFVSKWTGRLL